MEFCERDVGRILVVEVGRRRVQLLIYGHAREGIGLKMWLGCRFNAVACGSNVVCRYCIKYVDQMWL